MQIQSCILIGLVKEQRQLPPIYCTLWFDFKICASVRDLLTCLSISHKGTKAQRHIGT